MCAQGQPSVTGGGIIKINDTAFTNDIQQLRMLSILPKLITIVQSSYTVSFLLILSVTLIRFVIRSLDFVSVSANLYLSVCFAKINHLRFTARK